ncbi:MAG TPA: VTT domain-containing protein [Candidatus Paceibacterota bacterium]
MESFSQSIITLLQTVPLWQQMSILGFFSYAEGLPVIGSILPGGTIAIFAGSLSESGIMTPLVACIIVGIASFLGDMTGFFLGKRFTNIRWIQTIVTSEKYQKSWDLFDRHIALITIFGKLIPVVRSTPSIFAAVRGVQTRRYMIYSFLGSMLWGIVGVYAGKLFTMYFGERATVFILGLIVVSIIAALVHQGIKFLRKKYNTNKSE